MSIHYRARWPTATMTTFARRRTWEFPWGCWTTATRHRDSEVDLGAIKGAVLYIYIYIMQVALFSKGVFTPLAGLWPAVDSSKSQIFPKPSPNTLLVRYDGNAISPWTNECILGDTIFFWSKWLRMVTKWDPSQLGANLINQHPPDPAVSPFRRRNLWPLVVLFPAHLKGLIPFFLFFGRRHLGVINNFPTLT